MMKKSRWRLHLLGMIISCCLLLPGLVSADEEPLRLADAVRDALLYNLSLRIEKEKMVEAIGINRAAEGIFDTSFQAHAGRGRVRLTPLLPGATDDETSTSWSAGLTRTFTPGTTLSFSWDNSQLESSPQTLLFDPVYSSGLNLNISQPLLQGFGEKNQTTTIRATFKQQEARQLAVESRAADLAAEVKSSYWDLVFAWQDIEVKRISLTLAQKLLTETKEKIDAGTLASVEIFRPQSEVARREESLIFAERAIGMAEDRIKLLLNSDAWNISLLPTDRPDETIIAFNVDDILAKTLHNSPGLRAVKLEGEAAEITLLSARDRTRASLDLYGSVGVSGTDSSYGDSLNNLTNDSDTSWKIGLTYSIPLNNTFATGEVIRSEAARNQIILTSEILEQEIRRSVRAALRDITLAVKNMEATRKTSLATEKSLEAEQIKFDAGRGTTLDVLIAQEGYSSALSQENLARINYAKTLAELDRIQGLITLPAH